MASKICGGHTEASCRRNLQESIDAASRGSDISQKQTLHVSCLYGSGVRRPLRKGKIDGSIPSGGILFAPFCTSMPSMTSSQCHCFLLVDVLHFATVERHNIACHLDYCWAFKYAPAACASAYRLALLSERFDRDASVLDLLDQPLTLSRTCLVMPADCEPWSTHASRHVRGTTPLSPLLSSHKHQPSSYAV
jgi:hypothetical protein